MAALTSRLGSVSVEVKIEEVEVEVGTGEEEKKKGKKGRREEEWAIGKEEWGVSSSSSKGKQRRV
ncbi:hypothetical protein VPNG_06158 [Cytospora leucostoma]|uniref:Uncharacterized protein n=1 Tax=Cytospora leucostoma TaxID=1230097 RepID=A0A423WYL6_9PEZI|nr:hypothetical protein VPNG_06158 [Cytospora leucostoma]